MVRDTEPLSDERERGSRGDSRRSSGGRDDERLLDALRRGEESAFARLVDLHHASMVRVARLYVGTAAAAEEVAQEAWIGVLQGLDRFEGRCTLKSWIFAIVANCAKARGAKAKRNVPFSSLTDEDDGGPS